MVVADVMKTDVITLGPDVPVSAGLQRALGSAAEQVLVVERKRIVGVLCICELEELPAGAPVARFMQRSPEVIWPECSLKDAARRFVDKQVGSFPVCDGSELVGVLSRHDVLTSGLPAYELPGGFCCVFCGSAKHVRPLVGRLGLGACHDCIKRGAPTDSGVYTAAGWSENQPEPVPRKSGPPPPPRPALGKWRVGGST